jgi:hypothetical protein
MPNITSRIVVVDVVEENKENRPVVQQAEL